MKQTVPAPESRARLRRKLTVTAFALLLSGYGTPARSEAPPVPATGAATPATLPSTAASPLPEVPYEVITRPKAGLKFQRLENGMVLIPPSFYFVLDHEDEQNLYLRRYNPGQVPPATLQNRADAAPPPGAAAPASDRLRLTPIDQGLPRSGQWRHGLAVADINGDGHADLITAPPRKGPFRPFLFLGDGKGSWRPWREAKLPPAPYDYGSAAVADFDGDGRQDIALAMHLKGLLVLRQSAPGEFSLWSDMAAFPAGFSSRALLAADLDADGRPDLASLGEGPRLNLNRVDPGAPAQGGPGPSAFGLQLLINAGDGRWRGESSRGSERLFGDALTLLDANGDGRPDLLTATGKVGEQGLLHLSAGRHWQAQPLPIAPQAAVRGVAAADFDGDGRIDLALSYRDLGPTGGDTALDLLFGTGDGWQRRQLTRAPLEAGLHALAAADLEGDGRAELVALTDDGNLRLWSGNADRTLSPQSQGLPAAVGSGCNGYFAHLADLDGDRRPELVAAFAGEGSGAAACPGGGRLMVLKQGS